jgi:hypothetical protein
MPEHAFEIYQLHQQECGKLGSQTQGRSGEADNASTKGVSGRPRHENFEN